MRIIAGQFKGQKLCDFSAPFIRPMTDRVKTSLFDTLISHNYLTSSKRVLDLFSGTGNLSFEALSRGAKEVCLVEKSKKAIFIIKKNKAKLKINFKLKIYNQDVFCFLSAYKGPAFDLILADPPFKEHYGQKIVSSLATSLAVTKGTNLFMELSKQEGLPKNTSHYSLMSQKKFGDKVLLFYQYTNKSNLRHSVLRASYHVKSERL